jgi:phosphoglycolate phosphatase
VTPSLDALPYPWMFWDLDGTLTDPAAGITRSVAYALERMGARVPTGVLTRFIGPPLLDSFQRYAGMEAADARRAVAYYRERFQTVGIFENVVWPGIPELLGQLQAAGAVMTLATAKPQVLAERILVHFDLRRYFRRVVGSEWDGTRSRKAEVLAEALVGWEGRPRERMAMIGDHEDDMEAAATLGVVGIFAAYGYGDPALAAISRPRHTVASVPELAAVLLGPSAGQAVG